MALYWYLIKGKRQPFHYRTVAFSCILLCSVEVHMSILCMLFSTHKANTAIVAATLIVIVIIIIFTFPQGLVPRY